MIIGDFDTTEKVVVVAEIGNNHEGDFQVAQDLVRAAASCGVDAVKFQMFRTEYYVSRSDEKRFAQLKAFELSEAQFADLSQLAHGLGLLCISTPFDLGSADFLETRIDAYKVASGDNDFYPLLDQIARTGKPLILSTGLSDLSQADRSVSFVRRRWAESGIKGQLAVLHCVSSYPAPAEQASLLSIRALKERLGVIVGYSDHTVGLDAALLAVGVGARIIEKHFTLSKDFSPFRDHRLSADPPEMEEMVRRIRLAESMLGEPAKRLQPCEESAAQALRRSIVAGRDLPRGHRLEWSDLTWVRPAGGLPPGEEDRLVGKITKRGVAFGERLGVADVEEPPS